MHTDKNQWRRRKPLAAAAAAAIEYIILLLLPESSTWSSCRWCHWEHDPAPPAILLPVQTDMIWVQKFPIHARRKQNCDGKCWSQQQAKNLKHKVDRETQRHRETRARTHTHKSTYTFLADYCVAMSIIAIAIDTTNCRCCFLENVIRVIAQRERESCSCSGGMSCRKKSMFSIILCGTPGDLPLRPLLLLLRRFCGLCTRPLSLSHR